MKLSDATAIYAGAQPASAVYVGAGKVWPPANPLAKWLAKLANVTNEPARIWASANSIEEGTGASTRRKRSLDLVLDDLVRNHPVAGYGRSQYLPAHYAIPSTITPWAPAWRTSQSGTITDYNAGIGGDTGTPANTYGPGMRSSLFANGAIRTYTVTGTDVDIWTAQSGSFQYSIDGGAYSATVSTAAQNAYAAITQVHLGSPGVHTLAIKCVTSTALKFLGLTVYAGGRDKGIVLYDACHYGASTIDNYDAATPSAPQNAKYVRNLQLADPHLVILNLGLNMIPGTSPATASAQYQGLIDLVRATVPNASLLVCTVYNQFTDDTVIYSPYTYGEYKAAQLAGFAAKGVPALEFADFMPNVWEDGGVHYTADGLHMTDAGHALNAAGIGAYIDPNYVATRALDVGASVSSVTATSAAITTQVADITLLAMQVGNAASAATLTLKDNYGNLFVQADSLVYGGAVAAVMWKCEGAKGGPGHVFIQGGGGSRGSLSVVEAVNAGGLRDSNGQITLSPNVWPTGAATAVAGDLAVAMVGYDYDTNPASVTAGAGYTVQTQSTEPVFLHTAIATHPETGTSSSTSFTCNVANSSGFALIATVAPPTT